ncbi:hypothetical protein ACIO3O_36990 [Streptomyces sp. NPDC087440]|uniref:hypothetical protein n=1 Tax=Streptomyces sp. NPDC087440 TaxID=3365790 RepID=UPI0037F74A78
MTTHRYYEFVVPGFVIAGNHAASADDARAALAEEFGDTITFDTTVGGVEIQTGDFVMNGAVLDKVNGDAVNAHTLPDTEAEPFSVADIGRVAVGNLGDDWAHSGGEWGVSASLDDGTGESFSLEVVDGDLTLFHSGPGIAVATFTGERLDVLGAEVAEAVRQHAECDA